MHQRLLAGVISSLLPLCGTATTSVTTYAGYGRSPNSRFSGSALPSRHFASAANAAAFPQVQDRQSARKLNNPDLQLLVETPARELVIIDEAVPDQHLIYQQVSAGVDVQVISSDSDGLSQLIEILSQYQDLDSMHVFSHAQDGILQLGNSMITTEVLGERVVALSALDGAMKDGADLRFYGCNLASGNAGREFLDLIAGSAGVDVAASNDLTGSAQRKGDWDLEVVRGQIETAVRFDSVGMADFRDVLQFSGTLNFDNMPGGYSDSKSYTVPTTSLDLSVDSNAGGSNDLYNSPGAGYVYVGTGGSALGHTATTIDFGSNTTFNLSSLYVYNSDNSARTIRVTSNLGGSVDSASLAQNGGETLSFTGGSWTGVSQITIQYDNGAQMDFIRIDDMVISNLAAADSDGSLTAAGGVSEPVPLSYSSDTVGEAVDLFDFTLTDGGTSDGQSMTVSQVVLNVTGTASDTDRNKITWRLDGPDASNVTGVYSAGANTLTFSSLGISVADGMSEVYTVNGYFNDATGLTDGNTVILTVDGDTDLTVGGSGTQMGSTTAVNNGTGTVITDDIAPVVTSVSVPANNTYGAGSNLDFTVNFNELVTVNTGSGTPRLTLTVGAASRSASFIAGSGSSALTFRYTVQSGDLDSDGIAIGATIDPSMGTIRDGADNDASTTLNSIGSTTGVLVDAAPPTVGEVTPVVTPTNDTTPSVTFSSTESGTLAVGGSCGSASEGAIGSGNSTISLTQTDNSTALAGATYSDCTVTVTDSVGNASAPLTLTSFTIDVQEPTVAEVTPVSTPGSDSTPNVTFSSNEAGTLAVGGSCGSASEGAISSGNQTITLTQPDNTTALTDDTYSDCTVTVTDSAGNSNTPVTLSSFVIDTQPPVVAEVTPVVTPDNDATPPVTFSSNEAGTLAVGGSCGSASEGAIGSGNSTISLTQPDNSTALAAGTYADCTVTVTDAVGNSNVAVTLTSFEVDLQAPSVAEVTPVSTPGNNSTPNVTLSTDEAGTLAVGGSCGSASEGAISAGTATIALTQPDNATALAGGTYSDCTVTLTDAAGNANTPLTLSSFTVDLQAPTLAEVTPVTTPSADATPDVVFSSDEAGILAVGGACGSPDEGAVTAGSLTISLSQPDNVTPLADGTYSNCSITVTDEAGNNSSALTLSAFVVDQAGPTITSVTLPANGTFVPGATLAFSVNYNEIITVNTGSGIPRLTLTIGSSTQFADYVSGDGTNALLFQYTVQSDDLDDDGIELATVLDLNGGTLTDAGANSAATDISGFGSLAGVLVDGVPPEVSEATVVPTPGNDATPTVGLSVSESGVLSVGGSCGSSDEGPVAAGAVSVTLTLPDNTSALPEGTYSDCTASITDDAGNVGNAITLTSFDVDLTAPVISVTPRVTTDTTPALAGTVDDTAATLSLAVGTQTVVPVNNGDGTWSLADNVLQALSVNTFEVTVSATDGAGNIGVDATSNELQINSPVADLAIDKSDQVSLVDVDDLLIYTIAVVNDGPDDVIGAAVEDLLPAKLTDGSWTCLSLGSAACAESGTGNIQELVDLPAGDSVIFVLAAQLDPVLGVGSVDNTATVTAPDGVVDPNLADNTSTDSNNIEVLFRDEFEDRQTIQGLNAHKLLISRKQLDQHLPEDDLELVLVAPTDARRGSVVVKRVNGALHLRVDQWVNGEYVMGNWRPLTVSSIELQK